MVRCFILLLFFVSTSAFAEVDITNLRMDTPSDVAADYRARTEFGWTTSSINNGSQFALLGFSWNISTNWELGLRGLIPMDFERDVQIYSAQALARYNFVNDKNIMYMEGQAIQSMFAFLGDNRLFAGVGATYGYRRAITHELSAGVNVGVDYLSASIVRDYIANTNWTFYNRVAVTGAYNF